MRDTLEKKSGEGVKTRQLGADSIKEILETYNRGGGVKVYEFALRDLQT